MKKDLFSEVYDFREKYDKDVTLDVTNIVKKYISKGDNIDNVIYYLSSYNFKCYRNEKSSDPSYYCITSLKKWYVFFADDKFYINIIFRDNKIYDLSAKVVYISL